MKKSLALLIIIHFSFTIMAQQKLTIDSILADYQGNGIPGAALIIIKNGHPVYIKCYGYADIEKNIPIYPVTNFRLASVTKQFTATAILQMVQNGKIKLGTTLAQVFPGFPDYGKKITIHHLLNHTSGLPDYENAVPDTAYNPQIKDRGVLEILLQTDSVYFEPGTKYRYSNSAYALLALIVEKYSNQSFADYLKTHIFAPLQMNHTVVYEKGISTIDNRAFGYSEQEDQWILSDQSSTSAVLGDGGIYSNLEDMFKWDQSLYTEKILTRQYLDLASNFNVLNNGDTVHYGYGWHLKKTGNNEKAVFHTGSTTSFRNIYYRIPAKNFSLVLFTNRNRPQQKDMVVLAERITAAFEETESK